mmetsp:Transcript_12022/g.34752  ORF Transcript_12022/g.34752 Transcript_12022/m.34752 type:complete len:261 (+) Transcript_12022:129-911(+)
MKGEGAGRRGTAYLLGLPSVTVMTKRWHFAGLWGHREAPSTVMATWSSCAVHPLSCSWWFLPRNSTGSTSESFLNSLWPLVLRCNSGGSWGSAVVRSSTSPRATVADFAGALPRPHSARRVRMRSRCLSPTQRLSSSAPVLSAAVVAAAAAAATTAEELCDQASGRIGLSRVKGSGITWLKNREAPREDCCWICFRRYRCKGPGEVLRSPIRKDGQVAIRPYTPRGSDFLVLQHAEGLGRCCHPTEEIRGEIRRGTAHEV